MKPAATTGTTLVAATVTTLVADTLSLHLGDTTALDAVRATFASGQVTAVLGPNGAGKSTLLACLAGLRAPDSGVVRVGGVVRGL
uniref:ATP-binding cassette domain-containing protein n=1 Tax=Sandarakinorhabdus sp. TaxID=1916663 RepID=UPI00333F8DED